MRHRLWIRRVGWLGMVGAVLASGALVQAAAPAEQPILVLLADEGAEAIAAEGERSPPSEYWIGLAAGTDLHPALRAQLSVPDGQGLVIQSVVPDSPAAKAGFKEHDILLSAGGKSLARVEDLIEAVNAAKDQALKVELIREGKPTTADVTPEKRPADRAIAQPPGDGPFAIDPDGNFIWDYVDGERDRLFMARLAGRGMLMPLGTQIRAPLPKDMSVTITKEGDQPAKIVVKQGDKTWEVADDKLSDLPEDVRGHVEGMLGRPRVRVLRGYPTIRSPIPYSHQGRGPRLDPEHSEEFKSIHEQLEQLRKALEEIQERLKEPEAAK